MTAEHAAAVAAVEEEILNLLGRARTVWREAATEVHPDLPPLGLRLLSALVRLGPSRPGQLACALETDKSVISRLGRELHELGLLDSMPDPDDGRGRLLTVTPAAAAAVSETRRRALAGLTSSLDQLPAEQVALLAELLRRMNEGFAPA